jgi:dATP pyrophosphohydrolase
MELAQGRLAPWNVTNTYEIYATWRHRFAPGVTHNTEHVFGFKLPSRMPVILSAEEHTAFAWLPWREAADKCFSWSNRDAIRMLGDKP